jgi:nucleoside diphosphate kinase
MSRQPTARSQTNTARSRLNTSRSRMSTAATPEDAPPPPKAIDKFDVWSPMVAKLTERTVLLIKPDVVEEHEDDIIQAVEDFCEMRSYEILECSRIQLVRDKAMGYCLATQEARAVEDERLAMEEEARLRVEAENTRIEMERVTQERRDERQARRDAGDSDVEEDTVVGGDTSRTGRSASMTNRTQKTNRTNKNTSRTHRTQKTTGRGTSRTGRTGRSSAGGRTGRSKGGSRTSRQRAERAAEQQRLLEEDQERKLVQREKISSFLCGGEIIVMIVEGKECVSGLIELVGDDDVEYWPDFPDSLRSK